MAVRIDLIGGDDLAVVNGCYDGRSITDAVEATEDSEFEIAEPLAFADAVASGVDGNAAGNDQIDMGYRFGIDRDAVFRRS